jgi:hypothetical protein
VRPPGIVKVEIPTDPCASFGNAGVGPEINIFVFGRTPLAITLAPMADKGSPLDEDIVLPGAAAVHSDLDVPVFENLRERI